ncbi:MAG: hypothetical protein OXH76_06440, partial [Boseongicola sp.]|nr:hypothetical protein [Boseongicola sp.]
MHESLPREFSEGRAVTRAGKTAGIRCRRGRSAHGWPEFLHAREARCCDSVDTLHERLEIAGLLPLFQRARKSHFLIRNERNIGARRPKTAQVAVERAQHDA